MPTSCSNWQLDQWPRAFTETRLAAKNVIEHRIALAPNMSLPV